MSCKICGRNSCAKSFHSLEAQEYHHKRYEEPQEYIEELESINADLLEACEEALDQLESWKREDEEDSFTMRRLRETINKTKGE